MLPLLDQTGSPDHAFFADGFAEDVTLSLAGLRELFVVSAASSALFRGRLPDPCEVGRALGVRYALLGRMRPARAGVTISVELCDTGRGVALWADRMHVDATEIFDMQDEVVRNVTAKLAPQVRAAELGRAIRKPPNSLTAYERMLCALNSISSPDRERFDQARRDLDGAMEEEAGFALPFA